MVRSKSFTNFFTVFHNADYEMVYDVHSAHRTCLCANSIMGSMPNFKNPSLVERFHAAIVLLSKENFCFIPDRTSSTALWYSNLKLPTPGNVQKRLYTILIADDFVY